MPLPKPKHDTWPLDKIIEGQNARKVEIDEGIRELCNSIVANGLLQPLIVLDNYHLIAGFRRLAALRLAKVDSAAVSIYPSTLTPAQVKVINLTENVQRVDLSDPEIYLSCSELLKLNPEWARKDLAAHLGKDPSTLTRWLSPDDLIPDARQAFLEGKFGFAKAYAIAKLPPDQQPGLLAHALCGVSRDELEREAKQAKQNNGPPSERCPRVKIPLALAEKGVRAFGTVTVAGVAGEEIDLRGVETLLREAAKAVREAMGRNLGVKAAQASWKDMAARKPKVDEADLAAN